ncbi:MAG: hypothetical protein HY901_22105 [Deltaproteobacteria bacterium]|nr:hypothetical protein [Deltaproteobacteria bacterium]
MTEPSTHPSQEGLFLWVAGELDARAALELEQHVHGCRGCAERLRHEARLEANMREIGAVLPGPGNSEVPAAFFQRITRFFRPAPLRLALAATATVALVGFALTWRETAEKGQPLSPSRDQAHAVFPLRETASRDTYGYGDDLGVTVSSIHEARFVFNYSEAIPQVYSVTFEARGVERKEQIEITLNGVHLGYLEPSAGDYPKTQRVKLPRKYLKAGIANKLVFDAVDNPPNSVPWAIVEPRLLRKVLPTCAVGECTREAKALYDRADRHLAQRNLAAENRVLAWSELQRALVFLEVEDPESQSDLYVLIQATLRDVDRELDAKCTSIMLAAKRIEEMQDLKTAYKTYRDGLKWFPEAEDEHPCRWGLQKKIDEYSGRQP